jgi:hypothetical protein
MAVQGSSQDLKIFSSVRPLQIQRSFEGPPEATDIAEAVTRDVTIEKRSSVTTITSSQTSSSTVMSAVQHQGTADGVPTSPQSAASGTVTIKAASTTSTTSQVSPGTVVIRSSGAAPATIGTASISPGVGGQNVVMLRNPSSVAQTGPAPGQVVAGQGTIVIKSATTPTSPVTATVVQPNAQSRIVISPAPITQSRITITGGSAPVQTAPAEPAEVASHETQAAPAPPQGRRSSFTIKAAPSPTSPTPVAASPITSPASIQPPQSVAVSGEPPSSHPTAPEPAPQEVAVTEHKNPEPTSEAPTAAAPVTAIEDLSEKIHPKKPVGPTLEEVLDKFDISKVFYIALAVLLTVVICILSEGEIPLSWLLAAISVISLGSFVAFRL